MHDTSHPLEEPVVRTGAEEHRILAGRPALPRLHLVPARADVALVQPWSLCLRVVLMVLVVRGVAVDVGVVGVRGLV